MSPRRRNPGSIQAHRGRSKGALATLLACVVGLSLLAAFASAAKVDGAGLGVPLIIFAVLVLAASSLGSISLLFLERAQVPVQIRVRRRNQHS
jgi:hypothetical protein